MPFADSSFDFISCLGVLHHLRRPEGGFDALTRLLAPNGLILLYLYSRPAQRGARSLGLATAVKVRVLTVNMPRAVVLPQWA